MDISVGAIGAAVIAGLVSVLGLIITKEQKISEFRQAWIDELRKCLIAYISSISAIVNTMNGAKTANDNLQDKLIPYFKSLNEANIGILLRINENEKPARRLVRTMKEFDELSVDTRNFTSKNVEDVEKKFLKHSRNLLKFEWKRVKRGEATFFITKWIVMIVTLIMIILLLYYMHILHQRSGHDFL